MIPVLIDEGGSIVMRAYARMKKGVSREQCSLNGTGYA